MFGLRPQPGRAHLSSDPRINTARALVERERFAEALAILRPLVPDHPDQIDVRFLLGLAASRGSQERPELEEQIRLALLDEAIAAFRSILIRQPGLVRVRLELALAFYLKEEDALARGHFERALVGRPPEALVANINRFLNTMRDRRRWRGYFGFSVAPDTNINAASDAQFIYINGLPFRRGGQTGASSDIGMVGWGGGEYQYPLAARWRLRTGIDLNHREYKGSRFDQTYAGVYVGPRWLINRNTEMSLLATTSQRWWGGSSLNYDYGARLEVQHRVYAGLRLNGRALWSDRTYQQQKFLEGPLMVFSLGATYVPFPIMQVNLLVGYQQQEAEVALLDQCRVLDAGGDERGVAVGLYRGPQRRVPVDELREWVGAVRDRQLRPRGPDPHPGGHAAQPRDHGVRVQPPDRVFQPGARIQRATLRLQTQPRRNALGPPVLAILFCHPRRLSLLSSSPSPPLSVILDISNRGSILLFPSPSAILAFSLSVILAFSLSVILDISNRGSILLFSFSFRDPRLPPLCHPRRLSPT